MSGLVIGDPINDEIIERLMRNRMMINRYGEPDNLRVKRLEGGNLGGIEKANFRPPGGMYYKDTGIPRYIQSGGYPQFPIYNQLELKELDLMGKNTHISDYDVSGVIRNGAKRRAAINQGNSVKEQILENKVITHDELLEGEGIFGRKVGRAFKKGMKKAFGKKAGKIISKVIHETGDKVVRPVAGVGLDIGAMVASAPLVAMGVNPHAASMGPQVLANITKGYMKDPHAYQNKKKVGKQMLGDAKIGEVIAGEVMKDFKAKAKGGVRKKGSVKFKPAVMPPIEGGFRGARSGGKRGIGVMKPAVMNPEELGRAVGGVRKKTKKVANSGDKRKLRGEMIKKLMKENGFTLPQASKYIKDNKII